MNRYARGRRLEYDVIAMFKREGWSVMRGAGSKGEIDGMKADVVVTKRGVANADTVYMVVMQCKRARVA